MIYLLAVAIALMAVYGLTDFLHDLVGDEWGMIVDLLVFTLVFYIAKKQLLSIKNG
jgi:hypothetical protein